MYGFQKNLVGSKFCMDFYWLLARSQQ